MNTKTIEKQLPQDFKLRQLFFYYVSRVLKRAVESTGNYVVLLFLGELHKIHSIA